MRTLDSKGREEKTGRPDLYDAKKEEEEEKKKTGDWESEQKGELKETRREKQDFEIKGRRGGGAVKRW